MAMPLSLDQVRWVAHLARLDLSPAESDRMARDLSAFLDYVELLKQVDTDGVEPLAHPLTVHNVFRADDPQPSLPADEALANAPDRRGDFFGVPPVLD
jgi:aspartyl-tRNA(Asn)/glutamyl-tRNA(Gln) amidotransferase subunit C